PPLSPARASSLVFQARGNKHLQAVRVVRVNDQGQAGATVQEFACDLLCLATERVPANELLLQGGMRFHYQGGRWRAADRVPGLLAAGGAAGMVHLEGQVVDGRLRGWEAAAALGYAVPDPPGPVYPGSSMEAGPGTLEAVRLGKDVGADSQFGKRFVCLC